MRSWTSTFVACAALWLLPMLAAGCPGDRHQPAHEPAAGPAIPPPPDLLGHVSLAPVPRLLDDLAGMGRRFGLWKIQDGELFPLVQEVARAGTDLADLIDWKRPIQALILDPSRHPSAVVWLLPVRAPVLALRRLARRCAAVRRGPIWHFTGGGRALLPCTFTARALPDGLAVAGTEAALGAVWRYATLTTAARARQDPARHPSLEARVFVANALTKAGLTHDKLTQGVELIAVSLAFAQGDFTAAPAIREELKRLLGYATSATSLGLTLDLEADAIELRLFAEARPGGLLHQYIQSRRPGALPSLSHLPPRAPVQLALAPGQASTGKADPAPGFLMRALLGRLPARLRDRAQALLAPLYDRPPGTTSAAIQTVGAAAGGMCLVVVLEHPRPERLRDRLRQGAQGVITELSALLGRGAAAGSKPTLQVTKRRLKAVDVLQIDVAGTWPKSAAWAQAARRGFGGGVTLPRAFGTHRRHLVVALGAGSDTQVRSVLARLRSGAPGRQIPLPPGRLGLVRLSLVELFRALPVLTGELELPSGDTGGLLLHWGVNPRARQVDATLRLPVRHLLASAPIWKWLLDKIEQQTAALGDLAPASGDEPQDAL
ncbi:MAG: hypothetical protein ABI333_10050 [bacterium]